MNGQGNPVFLFLGIVMIVSGLLGVVHAAKHGITTTVTRRYVYLAEQSVHPTASGVGWRVRLGNWLIRTGESLIQNGGG